MGASDISTSKEGRIGELGAVWKEESELGDGGEAIVGQVLHATTRRR